MKNLTSILLLVLFSLPTILAQNIKFGKVSKQELEEKYYPLDSSANAAILYKKRRTYYEYNAQEGWTLITKVHERIKIYNKDGYGWATKKINLYTRGGKDESVSIKAYTFNLINGKVEKTKLKNNEVFKESINNYWNSKKFTMPNLTEGGILEWEYTIKSPYYSNIDDMVFQYKIPLKYIDTEVKVPEFFIFKNQSKGFFPINIKKNTKPSSITINSKNRSYNGGFNATKTTYSQDKIDFMSNITKCISTNIPALIEEPYINNLNNYLTSLKFELTAYKPKYSTHKYFNSTWEDVTKTIYESSNFGAQLAKSSHFEEDLQNLVTQTDHSNEKIGNIFQFVKSKIKWDSNYGKYTSKGVKKAYKEGTGNVAEINLTLVSMLRKAGVNANPVLVSTRSHGISLFPTSDGFNYVIAGVELNNNIILLDATEKYSFPNVLPLRDLNWQGRVIRKDKSSSSVDLLPKKFTTESRFLNAKIDEDGNLKGIERIAYNNLRALQYRANYNGLVENDVIAKLEKDNDDIEINELKITNKEDLAKPLVYQFDFETDNQVEIIGDKIYFSPLLFHTEKENPFKLEDRKFPVDYGTPWEDKYTISIELPEGYILESKPENVAYALPEKLGTFKFKTVINGNNLQVLSTTKINFPIMAPIYYKALKEFYKKMIDKQLEKIVLIKK